MEKEIKLTPFYFDNVYQKKYTAIIEVGGRFSSKTYNSQIEDAVDLASKEKFTLLVIEDLEKNMSQGYYAGLKDKIELFEQESAYKMTVTPPAMVNTINKNKALFLGYKTKEQKKAVKALDQVTKIVVEEGEWLTYDDFIALLHQLRGGSPEDRKLVVLMNPVNEYCFVNTEFIQSEPDRILEYFKGTKRPKVFEKDMTVKFELDGKEYTEVTTVLIVLSTHHDNNYLTMTQRATIEVLRTTDPPKYRQLGLAEFIQSGEAFFGEFDKHIHVVDPFIIPDDWYRYTAIDYGLDMTATLWFAIDYEGNCYCYKELYESDLIVSEATEKMLHVNNNENIRINYGPPDLMKRNNKTGETTWELFSKHGWDMYESDNRRDIGALAMKEWLKVYETKDVGTGEIIKTSRLKFFRNCKNIIRTLPQLLGDEKDSNKYATEPHELTHGPDALRYFCIMRNSAPLKETEEEEEHEDVDSMRNWNNYY